MIMQDRWRDGEESKSEMLEEKLTPLSLCPSPNTKFHVATTLEFLMFRI
jgi:hypothetical protein